jgi:Na+/glutamate symporter
MSPSDPRSWLERLTGVCLSLLVGAAAVFIAVKLIEAVWTALLVILGVGAFLLVAVFVLRARGRSW